MTNPILVLPQPLQNNSTPPLISMLQTFSLTQLLYDKTPAEWEQLHRNHPELHVFKTVFQDAKLFCQIEPSRRIYYGRQDIEAAIVLCENTVVQADMNALHIHNLACQYAQNNRDNRPANILLANPIFLERLYTEHSVPYRAQFKEYLESLVQENEQLPSDRPLPSQLFFSPKRSTPRACVKPAPKDCETSPPKITPRKSFGCVIS